MPNEASWLCLPGRADRLRAAACRRPRSTPNGYGSAGAGAVRRPIRRSTASTSIRPSRAIPGSTATWTPGVEEQAAAAVQFARFAQRLPDLRADLPAGDGRQHRRDASPAQDPAPIFAIAYGDVLRRLAALSRPPQQGPAVRADRPQPGHDPPDPPARRRDRGQAGGAAHALGAADRLQCRGARGQLVGGSFRTTPLVHARRPDRLRRHLCLVPRRCAAARGRLVRPRRRARATRSPAPIPAALGSGAGAARFLLVRGPTTDLLQAADRLVVGRARRRRRSCAPRASSRPPASSDGPLGYLAVTVNADPDRRPHRPDSGRRLVRRRAPARLGPPPGRRQPRPGRPHPPRRGAGRRLSEGAALAQLQPGIMQQGRRRRSGRAGRASLRAARYPIGGWRNRAPRPSIIATQKPACSALLRLASANSSFMTLRTLLLRRSPPPVARMNSHSAIIERPAQMTHIGP